MSYRNENGSTGTLKGGVFVAFKTQEEADAANAKPVKAAAPKPEADTDPKPTRRAAAKD